MGRGTRAGAPRARRAALATVTALLAIAAAIALRSCREGCERGGARAKRPAAERGADARGGAGGGPAGPRAAPEGSRELALPLPSPAVGWEEAAEAMTGELRRILDGRPRAGAYADARAEAARQDLALFPPERGDLRRLLRGSERERILALAALAARPDAGDELVSLVLRSQRPEDDDVVRLLGAELVAGLPPDLLARHEDDLLRAFAAEPNPLVLAVALPALERMDEARLRALLRAQVAAAGPEMLPVLLALARGRLAPDTVGELAASLGTPSAPR